MTQRQILTWAIIATLASAGLLAVFLISVPPTTPDGGLDMAVVAAFVAICIAFVGGLATVIALHLHRRWPALSGARTDQPEPANAVRQGAIVACAIGLLLVLALARVLDVAFFLVTLVVAGLVEAFFQNRY